MARNDSNGSKYLIIDMPPEASVALSDWMDAVEDIHDAIRVVLTMRRQIVLDNFENTQRIPVDDVFTLLDILVSCLYEKIEIGTEMIA